MRRNQSSLSVYPLLWLALLSFACILCVFFFPKSAFWLCASLFLFSLAVFLLRKRFVSCSRLLLFSLLLLLILLHATSTFVLFENPFLADAGHEVDATLCIESTQQKHSYAIEYRARVLSWKGETCPRVLVTLSLDAEDGDFNIGDVICGRFLCALPPQQTYGFPTRLYQRAGGIVLDLTQTDTPPLLTDARLSPLSDLTLSLRAKISRRLLRWEGDSCALSHALLLGDKSYLSPAVKRNFSQTGAAHVLAISGLHLSIFCGIFFLLLRPFSLKKGVRAVLLCIFLLLCCMLTGQAPSVLRAATMVALGTLLSFSRKKITALESLSLTGVLFALIDPHFLLDIRFLLSFFATLGIVTLLVRAKRQTNAAKRVLGWLYQAICTSLAAIFFTLPIVALYLGRVSFLGVLSSLILIPLCTLAIDCALLFLFLPSALCHTVLTDKLLSLPAKGMLFLAETLSEWDGFCVFFSSVSDLLFVLVFSLLLLLFLLFFLHRKRTATAVLLTCSLLLFPLHALQVHNRDTLFSFTVYTDGKSEAFLLTDSENSILIDAAKSDYGLCRAGLYDLSHVYRKERLDAFVCLSYSPAQSKRLISLLSAYYIDRIYLPPPTTPQEQIAMTQLATAANEVGCRLLYFDASITNGDFILTPDLDQTFTLTYRDRTLAYFNASWNQSQQHLRRYDALHESDRDAYLLFSSSASLPPADTLTARDSVLRFAAQAPFLRIDVPFLQAKSHKFFLFVA